jgi:hypothetical protein
MATQGIVRSPKVRRPFKLHGRRSYYIDINRKRRSLRTSDFAEALKLYNEIVRRFELEAKRPPSLDNPPPTMLGDFVKRYLAWSAIVRPPTTYRAERLSLQRLLEVCPQRMKLSDIRQGHLDALVALTLKSGLSVGTANHFIRHLKSVFTRATAWKLVPVHPFKQVKLLQ